MIIRTQQNTSGSPRPVFSTSMQFGGQKDPTSATVVGTSADKQSGVKSNVIKSYLVVISRYASGKALLGNTPCTPFERAHLFLSS